MSDEEIVIKTGIEQLFAPFQRLLDQLLGPAATEVGLSVGDSVKVWRFKRQLRLLQEVKRLVEHSGREIKPIATRLFFPILEAASIEDDDETQTRWAALIANEATNVGSVHPSYIDILRQLAPNDARLLDKLCDWSERNNTRRLTMNNILDDHEIFSIFKVQGDSFDNLVRLGLVQSEYGMEQSNLSLTGGQVVVGGPSPVPDSRLDNWYKLSYFAVRFVRACRAPTATRS